MDTYYSKLINDGEPFLVGPITEANFIPFVSERFINHIQSDLYFMNIIPTALPIYEFVPNKFYI